LYEVRYGPFARVEKDKRGVSGGEGLNRRFSMRGGIIHKQKQLEGGGGNDTRA